MPTQTIETEVRELFVPSTVARLEQRGEGDDAQPVIEGYAALFYRAGNPGTEFAIFHDLIERIDEHAFDLALAEKQDVIATLNHSRDRLLARTASGTLRLTKDKTGLRYSIDPPDTETGREAVELVRRRDIPGSSFMFRVVEDEWKTENRKEIRILKSVDLLDVSLVVRPAYSGTSAEVAKRSREEWRAKQPKPNLDRAKERLATRK